MTEQRWQDLLRRASDLRSSGRIPEAIAAYESVLALRPDLSDCWYNLALLQRQTRRFEQALRSYDRALGLGISKPEEVHLNRAVILSDHLRRTEEAEQELRAALNKNPRYVPALLNLGNLLEDVGNREDAREAYERAVAADPDTGLALARLAGVSLTVGLNSELYERLSRKLGDPRVSPSDKADLAFALAAQLDAAGEYDRAFEAARAANHASRLASGARYNRSSVEQFVDRSTATFDGAPRAARGENAPVFICGMFRSGSTLVEAILGAHAEVRAGGELEALPLLVKNVPGYPEAVCRADRAQQQVWRDAYLRQLPVKPALGQLVTDKRPENFLHVGLIKTLFPGAKIVNTIRDPLDNLLSLYFLHLDPGMAYALSLDDAAHWYMQYRRLMAHWKAIYPRDIIDLDYDLLVREPRTVIADLLQFLGLKWQDAVLDFHRSKSAVKTASVWQVRQPMHTRSSGRWRNYESQLAALRKALRLDQSE